MNVFDSRLTIKHLKMVYAIATTDSLTKAAEALNISQPALSNRLQNAESILGTSLFSRRSRQLALTPSGHQLLQCANTVLPALAQVEEDVARLPGQKDRTLRVGMPSYASYAWIPEAVKAVADAFPDTALDIVSEATLEAGEALRRREVDLALVSSPQSQLKTDSKRFHARHLFRDEFVALLPAQHRLAEKPFLLAEDFAGETYITNSVLPERNREYELFFQPSARYPERVVQVGFTGAIPQLVAAGIGTTIVTRWIMQPGDQPEGVTSSRLTRTGLFLNWFALFPKDPAISQPAATICDVIARSWRSPAPKNRGQFT